MAHYHAVVHKDDDSSFGVHFPDLPGCFSAAECADDIIPNAIEALSLYFEDCDIVPASDIAKIKALAADDLAQGAFLMLVPYVANDSRVVRANISLERGVLAAIDEAAALRKLTRSAFIAEAVRKEIGGRA